MRAYPIFVGMAMGLAGIACVLTTYAPAAAGSGIPQVKAELNGVRVPGALSAATLAVKLIGVTLVVASGLPCGREGPMVQLGAGVAAQVLHLHNKVGRCRRLSNRRLPSCAGPACFTRFKLPLMASSIRSWHSAALSRRTSKGGYWTRISTRATSSQWVLPQASPLHSTRPSAACYLHSRRY